MSARAFDELVASLFPRRAATVWSGLGPTCRSVVAANQGVASLRLCGHLPPPGVLGVRQWRQWSKFRIMMASSTPDRLRSVLELGARVPPPPAPSGGKPAAPTARRPSSRPRTVLGSFAAGGSAACVPLSRKGGGGDEERGFQRAGSGRRGWESHFADMLTRGSCEPIALVALGWPARVPDPTASRSAGRGRADIGPRPVDIAQVGPNPDGVRPRQGPAEFGADVPKVETMDPSRPDWPRIDQISSRVRPMLG